MKIKVLVELEFECTKSDIRDIHYDLSECLDEARAREEPLFGNEECKDEMFLTEWTIQTVKAV